MSDYPRLISTKVHSVRNFFLQIYYILAKAHYCFWLFSSILESALVIKKTDFPISIMMCNIKINIVFRAEKITVRYSFILISYHRI